MTVTHPEMTRYFMTIPEAAQLVLQAGAIGEGGEIFILDMGKPVKIVDVARDMIRLSGLRPDEDIQIDFTGLRPGEKLFEELGTTEDRVEKTKHPKIFIGRIPRMDAKVVSEGVKRLAELARNGDEDALREALAHPGTGGVLLSAEGRGVCEPRRSPSRERWSQWFEAESCFAGWRRWSEPWRFAALPAFGQIPPTPRPPSAHFRRRAGGAGDGDGAVPARASAAACRSSLSVPVAPSPLRSERSSGRGLAPRGDRPVRGPRLYVLAASHRVSVRRPVGSGADSTWDVDETVACADGLALGVLRDALPGDHHRRSGRWNVHFRSRLDVSLGAVADAVGELEARRSVHPTRWSCGSPEPIRHSPGCATSRAGAGGLTWHSWHCYPGSGPARRSHHHGGHPGSG